MCAFLIVGCFRRYVGTECTLHACRSMQLEHVDMASLLVDPQRLASSQDEKLSQTQQAQMKPHSPCSHGTTGRNLLSLPGHRSVPVGSAVRGMMRKSADRQAPKSDPWERKRQDDHRWESAPSPLHRVSEDCEKSLARAGSPHSCASFRLSTGKDANVPGES